MIAFSAYPQPLFGLPLELLWRLLQDGRELWVVVVPPMPMPVAAVVPCLQPRREQRQATLGGCGAPQAAGLQEHGEGLQGPPC